MISYKLLNKSIEFYESYGFTRIEVPWMVTPYVDNLTRPALARSLEVRGKNKNLIASGEQGFLYLYLKNYLPKGKFQTITPCFRDEPYDFTHSKVFMKNELTVTDGSMSSLQVCEVSRKFFASCGMDFMKRVEEGGSTDLIFKGVEVGSYGERECDFLKWVYGTGCAEPRTSKLLSKYGISY